MGNGDIDFMQNADGVAFDAMGEGLVVTSPFSDDAAEVKNWEEKAEEIDAPETSKELTGDDLADYFMAEFLKGDGERDGDDEPSLGRGVTLDKEQSPEGEDYSVGRWVAFPNARMTGKVRQIVDHAPSECGFMAYWLTSPELEPSHRFKTIGMKLNGHKSFGTKEDAEKYLQEAEGEIRKKILQIVTKDSLTDDRNRIFDPERFDQNSFEWGAIYWINQIRDEVAVYCEDGYVIPDEQFIEMLRPLRKAAKVYAEAHGKDKAWVKNTVLSVPKAFANAFDTLSDGEGVSKEHFLKVLTVEGVCALAEGDIDSVHELEDYYYRKGRYSPKGGYEVGRFVVIIKDPPSQKYESERIRRIIAICGEKDDDDPTLVFWNTSKSGIVKRKASQCSKPFHKWDDAYDWWLVENGDGAREVKNNPKAEEEKESGDEIYKAILSSMGMDEKEDWDSHCRHYHPKGFTETSICKYLGTPFADTQDVKNSEDAQTYYLGQLKELSYTESVERLITEYGVVCLPFDMFNETGMIERICSPQFRAGWQRCAQKPGTQVAATICIGVLTVLDDIKQRFGNVPRFEFLVPVETRATGVGGLTELDHILVNKAVLMISGTAPKHYGFSYGHKETILFDRIRHELGHLSATQIVRNKYDSLMAKRLVGLSPFEALKKLEQWSSSYAVQTSGDEVMAEMFSRVTDPIYKKGDLPSDIEAFVIGDMLRGKQ